MGNLLLQSDLRGYIEDAEWYFNFAKQAIQKAAQFYSTRYEFTTTADGGDLRSTIYWNPSVKIGKDGSSRFTFYTSDVSSPSYTVTIERVTSVGEIIHSVSEIAVDGALMKR